MLQTTIKKNNNNNLTQEHCQTYKEIKNTNQCV